MHPFFYNITANLETFKSAVTSLDLEKLELFGEEYFFQGIEEYIHREIYKDYIADTLRCVAENTAKLNGGSSPKIRYRDIINPQKREEIQSPEDVIAKVNRKCGLIMEE